MKVLFRMAFCLVLTVSVAIGQEKESGQRGVTLFKLTVDELTLELSEKPNRAWNHRSSIYFWGLGKALGSRSPHRVLHIGVFSLRSEIRPFVRVVLQIVEFFAGFVVLLTWGTAMDNGAK